MSESVTEPVTEPVPEPVTQAASGDVTDPATVPATDPASGPDSGSASESEPGGALEAPTAGKADVLRELELESEYAADYLEGLLDILDLDGDLDLDVEGSRPMVAIVGTGLQTLVGERGVTLEALQELTRLAVQTRSGNRSRLMLDIDGHRARRRTELHALGLEVAARVASTGASERMSPMSPFERKIVHDAVATVAGVASESEGEEPQRRVVVLPS